MSKFEKLRSLGYTGSINEMTLAWLHDNGASSPSLPDAWIEYLAIVYPQGSGNRTDDWYNYLGSLGYTGAISDREAEFWTAL